MNISNFIETYKVPNKICDDLISYFNEIVIYKYNLPIHHFEIIAGGGIDSIEDIEMYRKLGAKSFSLGTVCFNPLKLFNILRRDII